MAHPLNAHLPCTTVVVDAHLRAGHTGRCAGGALRDAASPLRLVHGRLHATSASDHALLAERVAQALHHTAAPRGLRLARAGRWPLTLRLQRAPTPRQVLIDIRDPYLPQPEESLLQDLFGLTPAEATVALALAQGELAGDIARARGVQPNTVNAHIKKLLLKTGTQRQSQLVALLLRSAAMPCCCTPLNAGGLPEQAMAPPPPGP